MYNNSNFTWNSLLLKIYIFYQYMKIIIKIHCLKFENNYFYFPNSKTGHTIAQVWLEAFWRHANLCIKKPTWHWANVTSQVDVTPWGLTSFLRFLFYVYEQMSNCDVQRYTFSRPCNRPSRVFLWVLIGSLHYMGLRFTVARHWKLQRLYSEIQQWKKWKLLDKVTDQMKRLHDNLTS